MLSKTNLIVWSNPIHPNRRSAVQLYFPQWWVFPGRTTTNKYVQNLSGAGLWSRLSGRLVNSAIGFLSLTIIALKRKIAVIESFGASSKVANYSLFSLSLFFFLSLSDCSEMFFSSEKALSLKSVFDVKNIRKKFWRQKQIKQILRCLFYVICHRALEYLGRTFWSNQ